MSEALRGIIPAIVTPFTKDYRLNTAAAPALLSPILTAGCSAVFACGATGEPTTMLKSERMDWTEAVIAEVSGEIPVIVHVGATSVENAVSLAKHAEKNGAFAIGTTPPLRRGSIEKDIEYYKQVGRATELPLYVYWRGDMARHNITPENFLEQMGKVPNFRGIKFTDSDLYFLQRLQVLSDGQLNCLTGSDEAFTAGLAMGCDGAIGTTYNFMPNHYISIYKDFFGNNVDSAIRKQQEANDLIAQIILYGVISGAKAILENRGIHVGPARRNNSLTPFSEGDSNQLRVMLEIINKYNLV